MDGACKGCYGQGDLNYYPDTALEDKDDLSHLREGPDHLFVMYGDELWAIPTSKSELFLANMKTETVYSSVKRYGTMVGIPCHVVYKTPDEIAKEFQCGSCAEEKYTGGSLVNNHTCGRPNTIVEFR